MKNYQELLKKLNEIAMKYNGEEYGLPISVATENKKMISAVREWERLTKRVPDVKPRRDVKAKTRPPTRR